MSAVFQQDIASRPELKVRNYSGVSSGASNLVLLHGWGVHSAFWCELVPRLQAHFHVYTVDFPGYGDNLDCHNSYELSELLEQLSAALPLKAVYLGWSMGGEIALAFSQYYPQRVQGVIALASNPCFVTRDDWDCAMGGNIYRQFAQGIKDNHAPTMKRFLSLMAKGSTGDSNGEKQQLLRLRKIFRERDVASPQILSASLALLAKLDLRSFISNSENPVLWIAGSEDALVPVSIAQRLHAMSELQEVHVIEKASHALLLSHPQQVLDCVLAYCRKQTWIDCSIEHSENHIEKKQIAESFSRAAESYDSVAQLQRHVGENLLNKIPNDLSVERMVDLGCGTGYFSAALVKRFGSVPLFSIDLAQGMLQYAKAQYPSVGEWIGGDAESLPLADASASLIFSSLAIQWSEAPQLIFAEAQRVLKNGGVFVFATLGAGTLKELRQAWQQVDDYTHVNRFVEVPALEKIIDESGLQIEVLEQQTVVMEYAELRDLTRELKALGAHNLNQGRPRGLTGRARIKTLKRAYENFRSIDGNLPASYDVIYATLRKK